MALLPKSLRARTPERIRDDVRLRAAAVGLGVIPPRTMHSDDDAAVLLGAARGARRVVEIGVYEGSSALALLDVLGPAAELHLIDPFGRRPDALPSGWGATEWATRRLVARRAGSLGESAPKVVWHPALSGEVGRRWEGEVDLVFIDGDHSEQGCAVDWHTGRRSVRAADMSSFTTRDWASRAAAGLPGTDRGVDRGVRAVGPRGGRSMPRRTVRSSSKGPTRRLTVRPASEKPSVCRRLTVDACGSVLRSPRHEVRGGEGEGGPRVRKHCVPAMGLGIHDPAFASTA